MREVRARLRSCGSTPRPPAAAAPKQIRQSPRTRPHDGRSPSPAQPTGAGYSLSVWPGSGAGTGGVPSSGGGYCSGTIAGCGRIALVGRRGRSGRLAWGDHQRLLYRKTGERILSFACEPLAIGLDEVPLRVELVEPFAARSPHAGRRVAQPRRVPGASGRPAGRARSPRGGSASASGWSRVEPRAPDLGRRQGLVASVRATPDGRSGNSRASLAHGLAERTEGDKEEQSGCAIPRPRGKQADRRAERRKAETE